MTLKEFFEGKLKAIKCNTEEQHMVLCMCFNLIGKRTYEDKIYIPRWCSWFGGGSDTHFLNNGDCATTKYCANNDIPVIDFEEIDELKKALNEPLSFFNNKCNMVRSRKQMTIKEFWESFGESIRIGIHCDTQEKADKLCMAFDRLGKTWQSGAKYEENMTHWGIYKEKTIYFNDGVYGSTNDYPKSWSNIIEFEDIEDFKMYKSFTKADLHSWDIVVFRDGKAGIVRLDMGCIIMKNGTDGLDDINNDLIFDTDPGGDIMQVYRPTEPYQCTYDEDKYYLDGKLMFDRNPKKKMTLAEIEKELGYEIELEGA